MVRAIHRLKDSRRVLEPAGDTSRGASRSREAAMEAMRASEADAGDGTVGSTRLDDGRRLGGELAVPARVPRKKKEASFGSRRDASRDASRDRRVA